MEWKTLTADQIAAMPLDEARALYPTVRADLHSEYQHVGPSAHRRAEHYAARRREGAASRSDRGNLDSYDPRRAAAFEAQADSTLAVLAERTTEYERLTLVKHLMAVRCGNLDETLRAGRQTMSIGAPPNPAWTADLRMVTLVRASEIGCLIPAWCGPVTVGEVLRARGIRPGDPRHTDAAMAILCGAEEWTRLGTLSEQELTAELDEHSAA